MAGLNTKIFHMTIKIYKTTTCPYCKMETEYLESKGIQFDEIFVDQDPKAAEAMIKISGQMGVPFTVIEKESGEKFTVLGFDKAKINQALGRQ